LAAALAKALEMKPKTIVLLVRKPLDATEDAETAAREQGVTIDTIALDGDQFAQEILANLAAATGGQTRPTACRTSRQRCPRRRRSGRRRRRAGRAVASAAARRYSSPHGRQQKQAGKEPRRHSRDNRGCVRSRRPLAERGVHRRRHQVRDVETIRDLIDVGQTELGESRVQQLTERRRRFRRGWTAAGASRGRQCGGTWSATSSGTRSGMCST